MVRFYLEKVISQFTPVYGLYQHSYLLSLLISIIPQKSKLRKSYIISIVGCSVKLLKRNKDIKRLPVEEPPNIFSLGLWGQTQRES